MPGPVVDPFHGDDDLPAAVDVVVIGGGIIGATTALELAERGVSVALCEKGGIAGEQSSRNWGWVRIIAPRPARGAADGRGAAPVARHGRAARAADAATAAPASSSPAHDEAALAEAEGWARALGD